MRALPYLPVVAQVAPAMLPVLPLPDESAAMVPLPALKLYEAESEPEGEVALCVVAVAATDCADVLPAASYAVTV